MSFLSLSESLIISGIMEACVPMAPISAIAIKRVFIVAIRYYRECNKHIFSNLGKSVRVWPMCRLRAAILFFRLLWPCVCI